MPRYASLIYNGFWFSKEREALQALIDTTQKSVNGLVRLELYKGSVMVLGRESSNSLFSAAYSTFEEDSVYDQKDAAGFIKLNALRFIIAGKAHKKSKKSTKKLDKSGAKKSGKKESKKKQK